MSTLTRWEPLKSHWNPWKDLEEMERRFSTMIGRPQAKADGDKEAMTVAEWSPHVDISEDEKQYVVKAELPEIKKEDVKLTVQDNVLCISGERKYEKEEKGKKYHRMERGMGVSCGASLSLRMPTGRGSLQNTKTAS